MSNLRLGIAKELDVSFEVADEPETAEDEAALLDLSQKGIALQLGARNWIYRLLQDRETEETVSSDEVLQSLRNAPDLVAKSRVDYARILIRFDTLLQRIGGRVVSAGLANAETVAPWPSEYPPRFEREVTPEKPELDILSIAEVVVDRLSDAPGNELRLKEVRALVRDAIGEERLRHYDVETTLRAVLTCIRQTMHEYSYDAFAETEPGYRKLQNPDLVKEALAVAKENRQADSSDS